MKLWYRCVLCSPDQSKDFDIPANNIDVIQAYRLVYEEHARSSPNCPASKDRGASVEMLVRMIQ